MKALVTGAAGFVGRHLCAHLGLQGDTVIGVDRADGPDLLDSVAVHALLAEIKPDVVYHLGGWSDVGASWDFPLDAFRVNAEGTLNLLQACVANGKPRVLAVSSADVYGRVTPQELPITESTPFRPVTPYAASKVAADQLALQAWLGHQLETIRVRAFNHLGPGQTTRFVAPAIAERIAINERDGLNHRCSRCRSGLPAAHGEGRGRRGLQRMLRSRSHYWRSCRASRVPREFSHAPRSGP